MTTTKISDWIINYPVASGRGMVYGLRRLKSKTTTAINLIQKIGFNRRKRRGINPITIKP